MKVGTGGRQRQLFVRGIEIVLAQPGQRAAMLQHMPEAQMAQLQRLPGGHDRGLQGRACPAQYQAGTQHAFIAEHAGRHAMITGAGLHHHQPGQREIHLIAARARQAQTGSHR